MPPVLGREAPGFEIFDFETTGRFYSPSPPYHLSGVLALCVYPVYGKNATVVLGPPDRPPNGEIIKQIMNNVKLNLLWSLPMFVEQVAKMPGGMEELQSLDHLCYTGGPLARWCGEALTGKVKISSFCKSSRIFPGH
jgi:acyl-coenzyme A synthetase/AMP-(fatty) acid ligase